MHLVLFLRFNCAQNDPDITRPFGRTVSGGFLLFAPDHGPALQLRDRLGLFDPDHVARLELVVLVMGVVVLRAADRLLVDRVGEAAIDAHHNRLGLLVADDDALKLTFRHKGPLTSSSRAVARRWS